MGRHPNFPGGRGGGGGSIRDRGGGGRSEDQRWWDPVWRAGSIPDRGGGGRGEGQRWWDPVWRAERLKQKKEKRQKKRKARGEMEMLEWRNEMEKMKGGVEQEMMITKCKYSRADLQTLAHMASKLELHFRPYNKGKTLVVSKVPLPNYRADLDESHGSTQKEIRMSIETERRVGIILDNSTKAAPIIASGAVFNKRAKRSSSGVTAPAVPALEIAYIKKKVSAELKERQDRVRQGSSLKEMQAFREKLPSFKMRAEFLEAVAKNQVLVISGETGCGKTTQLPQYILEEEISCLRGADCNIICTQPRRISAMSVSARISSERGENLGETVGYQIRLESIRSSQTRLLFCTTGLLLRKLVLDPDLMGVSHLLVDEIHERGKNEDFLLIILRDLLPRRPDLRLILMSATINADLFSKYFGNVPTINIPGLTFPVAELYLEDVLEKTHYQIQLESDNFQGNSRSRRKREQDSKKDPLVELFEDVNIDTHYKSYRTSTRQSLEAWSGSQLDYGLVEATIEHICRHEGDGAILVFLTGWDQISKLLDMIKGNRLLGDQSKFLVLPLHGSMPTIDQREIFDRPPPNKRKIVLSTNIAESSITIDDVVYVLDCGKAKETSYDALNKLASLLPSWISKASAHQRRGRAGRVQPGVCYRLYPKIIHDAMLQYQLPEILRTPLQELCLHIKSLNFGAIGSFLAKALQPPDSLSVQNAIELLQTIGALDDKEDLTPLGRHLCTIPVDPNIGKMLLMGCVFQCLDTALTIAAALSHRNPFVLPIDGKEDAECAKRFFAGDSCSDHIAFVTAFEGFKEAKRYGDERAFCWENYLSVNTLQMMEDMRDQFLTLLSDIGFVDRSRGASVYNQYSHDYEMVSAILCAGLYPNAVQGKRSGKRTIFYSKDVGKVGIHPGSVNGQTRLFPLPFMVYTEKVKTSSIFIRDSTNISDYALLLFGGNLIPGKDEESIEMLGGYLNFSSSQSVLQLIRKLRAELDKLLSRKIEEPSLDMYAEGKGVVTAAVELLHSYN